MQHFIIMDVARCKALELNTTLSIFASYLYSRIAATKTKTQVGDEEYFACNYEYIPEHCPILPAKRDTLQKLLKQLEDVGLIKLLKIGRNNCFTPSNFLRNWGYDITPDCTLFVRNTEKNPTIAEKNPQNTEKNPRSLNIDNNKDNINNLSMAQMKIAPKEQTLFGEEESKEKKTLFRNSLVYKLANLENGDYTNYLAQFKEPELQEVDMIYYFHVVCDWSDQKNMKRTARGWIATIRNFIRWDKERGKMHMKQSNQGAKAVEVVDAMEYLNNDY